MLIGLFIFILIGIVLLPIITGEVSTLTSPSYSYVVSNLTTSTVTIPPQVSGSSATILALVPLFYILVLLIVPAVIAFKLYKD